MRTRLAVAVLATALFTAGCSSGEGADPERVDVVATTSIWADVAAQVLGEDGTVDTIVPAGADPHDYQPSTRQIAQMLEADLVLANGLGLEAGLEDALSSASRDGANIVELGPALEPLPFATDTAGEHLDPHVWFDPVRAAEAAELIADQLSSLDPSVDWHARADDYAAQLEMVDEEITEMLDVVPRGMRKLITNHDALGYFADRHGFEIVGVVIPGGSTLAEPSSADLATLVATIRAEGVRAIFSEAGVSPRLADAVAGEVGADVAVVELFTGSLGAPGSGAESLISMLRTNAQRIADALG